MIEIYRKINKEETLVASVPDDNATLERTLMGADEVTLSVTVSEPLDLRVGDYARLEGSSYTINRAPDLVKASAVEFRYDLVLESPLYNLLDKIYISDVQGLSRFSLSGPGVDVGHGQGRSPGDGGDGAEESQFRQHDVPGCAEPLGGRVRGGIRGS